MTKKTVSRSVLFLLLTLIFVACSKYEEGSASLLSKKSRLVNNWKIQQVTDSGLDITSWGTITQLEIRTDETCTLHSEYTGVPTSYNGSWEFNDDKTRLLITDEAGNAYSYKIIMLQKDELKLESSGLFTSTQLFHFVSN